MDSNPFCEFAVPFSDHPAVAYKALPLAPSEGYIAVGLCNRFIMITRRKTVPEVIGTYIESMRASLVKVFHHRLLAATYQ